jgi:hypothetical protein
LVIKDKYRPQYQAIKNFGGNHVFKMPVSKDLTYEYMIFGAWSFGEVNNNEKDFVKYVEDEALKYNYPPQLAVHALEIKAK